MCIEGYADVQTDIRLLRTCVIWDVRPWSLVYFAKFSEELAACNL